MSRPAELLAPDRSRLFPGFETYRLRPLDPARDVVAFPLPGSGATQGRVGYGQQQLGFKEVRSRIAWDHLDTNGTRGVYIDTDWNVVGFELSDSFEPTFSQLASLPVPISSEGSSQAEYPRALALSPTTWVVSSGTGSLYVLKVSSPGSPFKGEFVARYDLCADANPTPFVLYAAHHIEGNTFSLLLSRVVIDDSTEGNKYKPREATFDLLEATVDASHANDIDNAPEIFNPTWILQGKDLPYWATWAEGGWAVLCEDPFEAQHADNQRLETDAERATREHKEKVAKLGLGASLPPGEETPAESPAPERMDVDEEDEDDKEDEKTYAFSWTQDKTSVTLIIPLPAGTTRSDITLQLSPKGFALAVKATAPSNVLSAFLAHPLHSFWSDIAADESTWTYDADKAQLEIDIQKKDEDMRWPSVFVPSDDGIDDDDDTEEVPETFAPSTLAAIRESFSQVHTRGDNEPAGNHPAIPALLREDMDFDLEDEDEFGERTEGAFADLSAGHVGRTVLFGHIVSGPSGVRATWPRQPASVLSLPLTTSGPDLPPATGVIVKTAVDGLLFAPAAGCDPSRAPWVHLGTNPALAFVMSSKRDLRLVRHATTGGEAGAPAHSTVLALESGSGTGQGNAYVYYPPAPGDTAARQGVVGVSGGDRGALLGVGAVMVGGKEVVVALCESSLVVLAGVV